MTVLVQSALGGPWERKPLSYLDGKICPHCEEVFAAGDHAVHVMGFPSGYWHEECLMRNIVGSVRHQQKRCTCYGGTEEHEDSGLSRRAAARAAYSYWQKIHLMKYLLKSTHR